MLKPDGLLGLNVWDRFEHNRIGGIMGRVIESHFETDPPRFLETPFGSVTPEAGLALVDAAGLMDIKVTTVSAAIPVPDYSGIAHGFVMGNPTILKNQKRASVASETVIQAGLAALEADLGAPPAELTFQETVFLAKR